MIPRPFRDPFPTAFHISLLGAATLAGLFFLLAALYPDEDPPQFEPPGVPERFVAFLARIEPAPEAGAEEPDPNIVRHRARPARDARTAPQFEAPDISAALADVDVHQALGGSLASDRSGSPIAVGGPSRAAAPPRYAVAPPQLAVTPPRLAAAPPRLGTGRPSPRFGDRFGDRLPPIRANTEEFTAVGESGFQSALQRPLSTFAIDVDTASYAITRQHIEQRGYLPPKGAVRIEEFVNYFSYDYPAPKGPHPFAVYTETSTAPWNPDNRLVHIGLQGRSVDTRAMPRQNLVFLIDVSGSMVHAQKLPLVRRSLEMLVDHLRPTDRIAIVVYAGAAGLVLPSTPVARRGVILDAIHGLRAGGSTAGAAGIQLAYEVARQNRVRRGNNRVILATDGDFNVGVSSESDLVELIERERESGVFLTTLGFGSGNYKDNKMERLSNAGNGNAAYIDSLREARKVLVDEMTGTLQTIAKDVKIQVEFNPARVAGYRLIGYENRALAARDFADDSKDAGELGAGHTVTALYEVVPAGRPLDGVPALKYGENHISATARDSGELLTVKLRYKRPEGFRSTLIEHPVVDRHVAFAAASDDFRFAAAVATYAQIVRGSPYTEGVELPAVIEMARDAVGEDPRGDRADFVRLARRTMGLARSVAQRPVR